MTAEQEGELRRTVALACRILAVTGLVKEITGHVSARAPDGEEMLIRCRSSDEAGLLYTNEEQVRRLGFDGGGPGLGLGAGFTAPLELPIHGEIYKARAEVGAVVHAHPPAALLCGLAGLALRPVFGAYDPEALALAAAGVPVYPHAVLIDNPRLGGELLDAMGEASVCLMRGHGITVTGRTVEEATVRAIKLEALARITWQLGGAGLDVSRLPDEEIASFERRSSDGSVIPGGVASLWRHYARLATDAASGRLPK